VTHPFRYSPEISNSRLGEKRRAKNNTIFPSGRRNFGDGGLASKDHHSSPSFKKQLASGTIQVTRNHRISPDFTKSRNLVRDQVLGPKVPEATPLVSTTRFAEVVEVWWSLVILEAPDITKSTTVAQQTCNSTLGNC
jgi:hypothetical protein